MSSPSSAWAKRLGATQIYDMVLRGAQIGPDDIDTAVKYMVASYGPGVAFPGQQPAQVSLADGAAKSLVEGGCALCHGLDRVVATKRSKGEWQNIVNRMVYFGSPVSGDQVSSVVDYLAANYSPAQTARPSKPQAFGETARPENRSRRFLWYRAIFRCPGCR